MYSYCRVKLLDLLTAHAFSQFQFPQNGLIDEIVDYNSSTHRNHQPSHEVQTAYTDSVSHRKACEVLLRRRDNLPNSLYTSFKIRPDLGYGLPFVENQVLAHVYHFTENTIVFATVFYSSFISLVFQIVYKDLLFYVIVCFYILVNDFHHPSFHNIARVRLVNIHVAPVFSFLNRIREPDVVPIECSTYPK